MIIDEKIQYMDYKGYVTDELRNWGYGGHGWYVWLKDIPQLIGPSETKEEAEAELVKYEKENIG